jgi:primosomal protein N' (replication factor Y)
MSSFSSLTVAAPRASYQTAHCPHPWIEVLVDCPGVQGLFTYALPPDLIVQPGDILSVPFGARTLGGIAIRLLASPPSDLDEDQIREVEDVITSGFFPPSYWQLLNRVAQYYYTDLMNVIRVALPPGLLARSRRRLRLLDLPPGAETFCNPIAQQVLALLKAQKEGDYSYQYITRQIRGARRGIQELMKRGWVQSYLEAPQPPRPKQQKAVTYISAHGDLTARQQEVLEILRRRGGELWLSELLQICNTSSSTVRKLADKGCVIIQEQEVLRLESQGRRERDFAKTLTPAQSQAVDTITALLGYAEVLLHGVTGSGKTEVYLQAIAPVLAQGKSALVLVPEIGLTPQLTDRFRDRFGNKVWVYHSALSAGERYDTWRQMFLGEPQVIIGTRSAVFSPLPNLGLIVLDEEHDSSFKQARPVPTYHARTVAQWRAELENCPLVLGSATPALETWVNVTQNPAPHTHYLALPQRIQARPLPTVEVVDMRSELKQGNRSIFSQPLRHALQSVQDKGEKAILFISRRGHSTFVSCRSCGYVIECPDCDVSLSYHYTHTGATELLRCHYCNHTRLQPPNCPQCSSPYLKQFGSGTQRVELELKKEFPGLRPLRFDSDTTRRKGEHRRRLERFRQGEADILVGTQMLTKGLDIAEVTLVGIVAADGLLFQSDYRASERAFQTMTQVAGRAGRGDNSGKVILQTYNPEHPVIGAVKYHNYLSFTQATLEQRQSLNYPPYGKAILLSLSGLEPYQVQKTAQLLAQACGELLGNQGEILGPAPAKVMRVARRYRFSVLLKLAKMTDTPDLSALYSLCPSTVSLTIDVDPLSIE